MPKPRGGQRQYASGSFSGSRFQALNDYQNDHDDRDNGGRKKERNTTRRVSFKPSALQNKGGIKSRLAEMAVRRLEDDEDMDGLVTNTGHEDRRAFRRKGSPIPRGKFGQSQKLAPNQFGWYQVSEVEVESKNSPTM